MRRTETPKPIWIKFCMVVDISDVVKYTNFGDHQLRGFWVAGGQISPSPIDFHRRPCNTLALLCERVIHNEPVVHTHPFNGPLSGTTQVSWHQKGKTNLDFTEARDDEWQWHQLGHMQICTSLQTNNHASTPPLCFYRPDALPATQPTVSKHWRRNNEPVVILIKKQTNKRQPNAVWYISYFLNWPTALTNTYFEHLQLNINLT